MESLRAPPPAPTLSLLAEADSQHILAWRDGCAVRVQEFLADVRSLADRLPAMRYAVNLCTDRYRFLVAFCAVATAGQTNLLPASRAPQAVAEIMRTYADAYALADVPVDPAPERLFMVPEFCGHSQAAQIPNPTLTADQLVAIGFTSGSTGQSAANPKTWGGLCASTALNAALLCAEGAAPNLVATVPAQHMYGLETSILLPLRSRAAIHAGHPFFPADVAHALASIPSPRVLVTTPVHLRALLRAAPALPALEAIVSATAPLDAALANAAEQRYATRVIELFGSTETCVIAHRRTAQEQAWHLYPGISVQTQPDGSMVHAPHFSAPLMLHDIVELLPARQFMLRGRNSDLLEIAGKRASLAELNRRLLAIAGVADGVAFALDADANGVCRVAALVVAPGLDASIILLALRQVVDPVFLPRPLRLVSALPRNATGKLPRAHLLAALHQQV